MRKFFAAVVVSAVALVGFAGAANASATVDLFWGANGAIPDGTTEIDMLNAGEQATVQVILTAGPNASLGGGISIEYSGLLAALDVIGYAATPSAPLNVALGVPVDTGHSIQNIGAGGFSPLAAGATFQLGTVTFQRNTAAASGVLEVPVLVAPLTSDGILNGSGIDISSTTTFNSAFVNVPEPGAISLLVMGLGGVLLAGRGRKS
jgi:hypothetical protein